jgi:hypothetical protein
MATIRLRDMAPAAARRAKLEPTGIYRDLTPAGPVTTIDIALADYIITITPEEWAEFSSRVDDMISRAAPRNIGG